MKNKSNKGHITLAHLVITSITGGLVIYAFHLLLMKVMQGNDLVNSNPDSLLAFTSISYVATAFMVVIYFVIIGALFASYCKGKNNRRET